MTNVATRRHGKLVNVAFVDGSVRSIQLPELWALKWHPTWVPPQQLATPKDLPPVPW
jgi:prepilin-type processing-associated H-X9-DG protein